MNMNNNLILSEKKSNMIKNIHVSAITECLLVQSSSWSLLLGVCNVKHVYLLYIKRLNDIIINSM